MPNGTIRSSARSSARSTRKAAHTAAKDQRQIARTYKSGARLVARGDKQGKRTMNKIHKNIAQHKAPSKSLRYRNLDASVKIESGKKIMASAAEKGYTPEKKKRLYRSAPAMGMGPNTYVTRSGKTVVRKKQR